MPAPFPPELRGEPDLDSVNRFAIERTFEEVAPWKQTALQPNVERAEFARPLQGLNQARFRGFARKTQSGAGDEFITFEHLCFAFAHEDRGCDCRSPVPAMDLDFAPAQ